MSRRLPHTRVLPDQIDVSLLSTEKHYFKILQVIYHADFIFNAIHLHQTPSGMLRQARKLSAFIKPAVPTAAVLNQVSTTTDTWLTSNLDILHQHYTSSLQHLSSHLPPFHPVALEKAISYGYSRYKKKLKQNILTKLTQIVRHSDLPHSTPSLVLATVSPPILGRDSSPSSDVASGASTLEPNSYIWGKSVPPRADIEASFNSNFPPLPHSSHPLPAFVSPVFPAPPILTPHPPSHVRRSIPPVSLSDLSSPSSSPGLEQLGRSHDLPATLNPSPSPKPNPSPSPKPNPSPSPNPSLSLTPTLLLSRTPPSFQNITPPLPLFPPLPLYTTLMQKITHHLLCPLIHLPLFFFFVSPSTYLESLAGGNTGTDPPATGGL